MTELRYADPLVGRHLFRVRANLPPRRWERSAGLDLAGSVPRALAALAPFFGLERLQIIFGDFDEHGLATSSGAQSLEPGAPWPDATVVEAMAAISSIRIGVPPGATLGDATTYACDAGFLRRADVGAAPPIGKLATRWLRCGPFLESRVHARVDLRGIVELTLGTSLHDAGDLRDPTLVVEGASLADWRAASIPVVDAVDAALREEAFVRAG